MVNWQEFIKEGKTQPIFDYEQCIFEKVYVETDVDTDQDGKADLIQVYIRRPRETLSGFQVPAIYVADPYMLSCNEDWYLPHCVDQDVRVFREDTGCEFQREGRDAGADSESAPASRTNGNRTVPNQSGKKPEKRVPLGYAETAFTEVVPLECISDWYSYFNSRGYASVFCGGLGTKGSEGFVNCGSAEEASAFAAVIDWLNGRRRAFTNREDCIEIKASWCTGNVAMSGKSYLGTMCIAVAATGVEGLKTIIPEAAISNWYAYYRYHGLVLPPLGWQGDDLDLLAKYCYSRRLDQDPAAVLDFEKHAEKLLEMEDRESGNYSEFWDERNYLNSVANIKASVYVVHGINDWNVKTNQCFSFWKALEAHHIPQKMMLHQGEHIYIHNLDTGRFNEIMHQWLDYWLYGIENGAMDTIPEVLMQSNLDQDIWYESNQWPIEGTADYELKIQSGEGFMEFIDDLSLTPFKRGQENFKDWQDDLILGAEREESYFIRSLSSQLEERQRINGTVTVHLEAALDKPTAILSAMLVDYGKAKRLTTDQFIKQKDGIVWGYKTPKADLMRFSLEEEESQYRIITRGWLNAQNRSSICYKEEICEHEFYQYAVELVPTDYVIEKGHRIGLILYGTDPEATLRPHVRTRIKVKPESVRGLIPVCSI